MRKIIILVIIVIIPLYFSVKLFAQDKTLIFFGDSRAAGLGLVPHCVTNAMENGELILDPSDITATFGYPFFSQGGWGTVEWVGKLHEEGYPLYGHYATHISLGGNDIIHLYRNIAFEKSLSLLHSKEGVIYWLWEMDTCTSIVTTLMKHIIEYMLVFNFTHNNKVLLNDVAPILDWTASDWKWQYFYLVNYILEMLNQKYKYEIVDKLSANSLYRDRIAFLDTFQVFWDNLVNNGGSYYSPDLVHYDEGNVIWGRMIAKKLGTLGWYALNEPIVCAGDNTGPTFSNLPGDGVWYGPWGSAGFPLPGALEIYFNVTDANDILDVNNAEHVSGTQWKFMIPASIADGSYSHRVTAADVCGNITSFTFIYTKTTQWVWNGWIFGRAIISYYIE